VRLLLAASLTLFAFCNVRNAQGSDCNYNASPCEALANADAVFIGQVTKIAPETISIWQRDADYDQTANVVIEKMYKGLGGHLKTGHRWSLQNRP
jgi:hypothetical protein